LAQQTAGAGGRANAVESEFDFKYNRQFETPPGSFSQKIEATMSKTIRALLQHPFHPWILASVPILHLYSVNFGLVIDQEVPIAIIGMFAATTACFVVTYAIIRNWHKTAVLTSIIVLCFSLSGHIHSLLFESESLPVWTLTTFILLATVIVELQKRAENRTFHELTPPINLIALAAILLQIATLAGRFSEQDVDQLTELMRGEGPGKREVNQKIMDSPERPDVYFIVPDSYPSDAWLKSAMDYDNSDFTEALESRGFVVASHAQSNYGISLNSLASTLNMRYFASNPSPLKDSDYLRLAVANNDVARYFRQVGYTYVQLLSGYLIPGTLADINREFTPSGTIDLTFDDEDLSLALYDSELQTQTRMDLHRFYKQPFLPLYLDTTLLKQIAGRLERLIYRPRSGQYGAFTAERFLDTVAEAETIAEMSEATFTMIHLLKPHRPVFFNERGEIIDRISRPKPREYFAEFGFVNQKFLEMIDAILDRSTHPPVIIFQADHGSIYGAPRTEEGRLIHFDAYAAYYLPSPFSMEIPRPYTLINAFPLILNALFDAGLDLNDNRLYEVLESSFVQKDVTDIFAH